MSAREYFDIVTRRLGELDATQMGAIHVAGAIVARSIAAGGRVWIAKTTHCLHDEVTFRAGGLMAVHALDDPISIERDDAVIIGTNAGTTFLTVETALIARERGATVIVLTQMPYETHPDVVPEHPSGKRLNEVADVLIDLGGQLGDGELEMADGVRILPGSGVAVLLAGWMIFAEAIDRLAESGKTPLVWQSMQITGANERNGKLIGQYQRNRTGFS